MKIKYKNLMGSLKYFPQLKIYIAEFIIGERVFSFSGENEFELYNLFSKRLDAYTQII